MNGGIDSVFFPERDTKFQVKSSPKTRKLSKMERFGAIFYNWIANQGRLHLLCFFFASSQIAYFGFSYFLLWKSNELSTTRDILGHGLMVARSAANVINLDCAILILTVCRNTFTWIRSSFLKIMVPFDEFKYMHIHVSKWMAFWSIVHTAAHFVNYLNLANALIWSLTPNEILYKTGAGITGQLLCLVIFIIITGAGVKRNWFEIFWVTHFLFLLFYGLLMLHGTFCFIKSNPEVQDRCRGGATSYKWVLGSLVWYLFDRLLRILKSFKSVKILKVVHHPSETIEIQMEKCLKYKPGQFVSICCPEISTIQWHPFTLTSCSEEKFMSVHIRIVGDWTSEFSSRLGINGLPSLSKLPILKVDGPYGTPSEDAYNYKVSILIGGGIGITPFASVLKSLWYKMVSGVAVKTKFYLIWICRDQKAFEWFKDLIQKLEEETRPDIFQVQIYLTGKVDQTLKANVLYQSAFEKDALTGLGTLTRYGRPRFNEIFEKISAINQTQVIGVFFCGPKSLGNSVKNACDQVTLDTNYNTKFYFFKEQF